MSLYRHNVYRIFRPSVLMLERCHSFLTVDGTNTESLELVVFRVFTNNFRADIFDTGSYANNTLVLEGWEDTEYRTLVDKKWTF